MFGILFLYFIFSYILFYAIMLYCTLPYSTDALRLLHSFAPLYTPSRTAPCPRQCPCSINDAPHGSETPAQLCKHPHRLSPSSPCRKVAFPASKCTCYASHLFGHLFPSFFHCFFGHDSALKLQQEIWSEEVAVAEEVGRERLHDANAFDLLRPA